MNTLSLNITSLMKIKNIASIAELARLVKISQPTLHRLLAGKTKNPDQKIMQKIANYFHIPVNQLLANNPLEKTYISNVDRHHATPSAVLRYLIQDVGNISEGELFRRTGVPQPTIHRILSGATPNPRMESLEPLAEFFNVSTDQLLGRIPLSKDRISGSFSAVTATKKVVPLLNWLEVVRWPKIIKKSNFKTERDWVTSESGIAGSAFALKITTTDYAPEFRKGSTIIVDCSRSLKEGDFVLGIQTKNNIVLLGEFIVEKNKKLLRLFSQLEKEFQIDKAVTLCGVIAEAKHSF